MKTGEEAADEAASDITDALSFFNIILLVFALIALFVGSFLILNTFSMLISQRTRELALLRAVGATRGQVTRSILAESLVVGAVSSVLGCIMGIGVVYLLRWFFGELRSRPRHHATSARAAHLRHRDRPRCRIHRCCGVVPGPPRLEDPAGGCPS